MSKSGPQLRYKEYDGKERKLYQQYLSDIWALLFKPKGNYQKFLWDTMSDYDKVIAERRGRSKKSSPYHY